MRTETVEKIVEKAERLSAEQQDEILQFVEKFDPPQRNLHEIWLEISKDAPKDLSDNMPTDASFNLNHYLYGAPKK
ncbi:hypothetical protein BH10ACI3_BH10ACI3_08240 [soil metagenome]